MKFHADNLEDIAKHFDHLADDAQRRHDAAGKGRKTANRAMRIIAAEVTTWREAAGIIRKTELAGVEP